MGDSDRSSGTSSERRAQVRRAVRKHIHRNGQPRDRKPGERDLLEEAVGGDGWEKTAWLKAQRASLDLLEKMDTLIDREFVSQRLSELGRMVADSLEKIPARVAHELAAERSADKIRVVLEREIRGALVALADSLEGKVKAKGKPPVDVKKEQRKGHRGVRRSRPVEMVQ